jgi:hypothetical protein
MHVGTSHLEQLLDWQLNSFHAAEKGELRHDLQKNRDRHFRKAEYIQREVTEKRIRRNQADDDRFISAWHAVQRGLQFILKHASINLLLEPVRINYRNKRDGTAIEIPEVNVDKLTADIRSAHTAKLQEICFGYTTERSELSAS